MSKKIVSILLLLTVLGLRQAFAVSEAAVLFLLISPGPQANAMGQTHGTTAGTSPMAAIMNPAALGFFIQKNVIGQEYYPDEVDWLPQLASDLTYDARIVSFGINLQPLTKIPIAIGIANSRIYLDLGEQFITGEESPEPLGVFSSYEKCEATTLALSAEYYLRASIGISWKKIESKLAPAGAEASRGDGFAKIDAHDLGLMLQLPLVGIGRRSGLLGERPADGIDFWLDPGLYFAKTNIGGKISYIDAAQADPLPRILSLGINFQAGAGYRGLTLAGFSWSREIDDLLIERQMTGASQYVSGLHDIAFWDNVVRGKANDQVISKRGYEINFADFYFVRRGTYEDSEGWTIAGTSGYGINYLQPLKIAASLLGLEAMLPFRVIRHLSFEKNHAEYDIDKGHALAGTKSDSYVFRLSGLSF